MHHRCPVSKTSCKVDRIVTDADGIGRIEAEVKIANLVEHRREFDFREICMILQDDPHTRCLADLDKSMHHLDGPRDDIVSRRPLHPGTRCDHAGHGQTPRASTFYPGDGIGLGLGVVTVGEPVGMPPGDADFPSAFVSSPDRELVVECEKTRLEAHETHAEAFCLVEHIVSAPSIEDRVLARSLLTQETVIAVAVDTDPFQGRELTWRNHRYYPSEGFRKGFQKRL